MNTRRTAKWNLLITAAIGLLLAIVIAVFCIFLPNPGERILSFLEQNQGQAFFAAVILLVLVILSIHLVFHFLVLPLLKMIEEVSLIGSANSSYRLKLRGGPVFSPLVEAINSLADRFEAVQKYGHGKVESIRAVAEKERNILAAIMAGLPEGVLVCNTLGSIVLFNQQAKQLLSGGAGNGGPGQRAEAPQPPLLGLWRPIQEVIDGNQLQHALDEIQAKFKESEKNAVAHFATLSGGGQLLRVEVIPVLDHSSAYAGFILIIQDITQRQHCAIQAEGTLTALTRGLRTGSANIRAAIESILAYPDLDRPQLDRLQEIIHKEAVALAALIGRFDPAIRQERPSEWPLAPIEVSALAGIIRKRAREKLDIIILIERELPKYFINADSYALTLAILFLLVQIQKENGPATFSLALGRQAHVIHIDITWPGKPVKMELLRSWKESRLQVGDEHLPFSLRTILQSHNGDIGPYLCPGGEGRGGLRFFLPAIDSVPLEPARRATVLSKSRPEFFDFDLFERREPGPELAHRLLSDLDYCVFDTETTGLNPHDDEIVSIGAVRIVNGRILFEESFDQLINPLRDIPAGATRVHGIHAEMVRSKPPIVEVLPHFQRFATDTILVGHNVAFDMRLLQVKEEATRVRLTNPVLDTLLLSSVLHPAQSDHRLEAIAERLGVSVEGRHTAMGDAVATARIFLKMVPMMAENGILTLDDAMRASRKTIYARMKY